MAEIVLLFLFLIFLNNVYLYDSFSLVVCWILPITSSSFLRVEQVVTVEAAPIFTQCVYIHHNKHIVSIPLRVVNFYLVTPTL